ncbi:hypothetical protein [Burkholderia ubonensis]|uniref:hypothetical protein n=1 Tax=Burkholderia ubonensis TaxID=101571 RepID=UPI000ADEE57C|nr:hypothetical protein [Burkholderia ubonensis]
MTTKTRWVQARDAGVRRARNHVRMRYYTNVPAWKRRVPRTIQAWRDRIDSQLPIDLMR